MIIYGEYLFLENFITGLIILMLTGKLCGIHLKKIRLIVGSAACGLFSFIIFIEMNNFAAIGLKLGFSAALMLFLFRPKNPKQFVKPTAVFYLTSFAMGGITIGLMYFVGAKGVANNSFVYLNHITYLNVLAGTVLTYLLINRLAVFIKDRIASADFKVKLCFSIDGKEICLSGMVDTGNFLTEPISGLPVMILSGKAAKEHLPAALLEKWNEFRYEGAGESGISEQWSRISPDGMRFIPFETVGGGEGMLLGFKPSSARVIAEREERNPGEMYIAISDDEFGQSGENECAMLLHRDILDKGMDCYG